MQDGGGVSHAANVYIYLINGATGAIRTTIANNLQFGATHNPSTEMTYYGTVSGGAATISVGDYLAVSFNLGSSATPLLYSGGATEITADGASTADAASAITLPSGSSLSFYGAALGISGGTKRREW
jgi:urease accessory protein UreH